MSVLSVPICFFNNQNSNSDTVRKVISVSFQNPQLSEAGTSLSPATIPINHCQPRVCSPSSGNNQDHIWWVIHNGDQPRNEGFFEGIDQ